MKRIIPLLLIVLMVMDVFTQEKINIPEKTPAVIDGIVSPGEWEDASSAVISLGNNRKVKISYKRDNDAFYFLFTGTLGSYGAIPIFPEVVFDLNNSKSEQWQEDDWWFHVSATDCEAKGMLEDYSNCLPQHIDWLGVPNFSMGAKPDTIEMMVRFEKIKLDLAVHNEIGLGFMVNNTNGFWKMWPEDAGRERPATWATAELSAPSSVKSFKDNSPNLQMFPNPSSDELNISMPYAGEVIESVKIVNVLGKPVINKLYNDAASVRMNTSRLYPGIYYVEITTNNDIYQKKLVIQ